MHESQSQSAVKETFFFPPRDHSPLLWNNHSMRFGLLGEFSSHQKKKAFIICGSLNISFSGHSSFFDQCIDTVWLSIVKNVVLHYLHNVKKKSSAVMVHNDASVGLINSLGILHRRVKNDLI